MKVIIINGAAGVGKDTIVTITKSFLPYYTVKNLSTIDDVKKIAEEMGWDEIKDEKGRKFLSELKRIWTEYNGGPAKILLENLFRYKMYESVAVGAKEYICFIHCREPKEIQWFVDNLKRKNINTWTMIVKRDNVEKFNNNSDSNVNNYKYDIEFDNNKTWEELYSACEEFAENLKKW